MTDLVENKNIARIAGVWYLILAIGSKIYNILNFMPYNE